MRLSPAKAPYQTKTPKRANARKNPIVPERARNVGEAQDVSACQNIELNTDRVASQMPSETQCRIASQINCLTVINKD